MSKIAIIGLSGESIFLKLDKLPIPSVTMHASNCHIEPGGKGFNQAIACKKNKQDVYYLSKIGNDTYGTYCKSYMDAMGINTKFILDNENKTAVATILTSRDGENEVIVYPGASNNITTSDVKSFETEISNSDILLVQYEIGIDALKQSIKIAKENNVLVVLNPAPAIYNDIELLNSADIVTPNFEEAKTLYNLDKNIKEEELGSALKDIIPNVAVITLGSKGCLLINNHDYKYYKAYCVDAVDTTGAGDTFNAGIVSIINRDLSNIEEAINYASIAASLSVTKPYVMESIPTFDEVKKFQQLYNLKEKK